MHSNSNNVILPESFVNQMKITLGDDCNTFLSHYDNPTPISIRWHKRKSSSELQKLPLQKVPWNKYGQYLPIRPKFTLDPLFHSGAYYVQEASSMFLLHILEALDLPKKNLKILDLCAAPGGKSSILSQWLDGEGLLVCNETIGSRAKILRENMVKNGYNNVIVTQADPIKFNPLKQQFDIILVDAPCSGEGMFRKDNEAITNWSESHVWHCSARQKRILEDILPSLAHDGYLIYSTCTFNDQENIFNSHWMNTTHNLLPIEVPVHEEWQIRPVMHNSTIGYRFIPPFIEGEGFYVSVSRNNMSAVRNNTKSNGAIKNILKDTRIVKDWVTEHDTLAYIHHGNELLCVTENVLAFFSYLVSAKIRIIQMGVIVGQEVKNGLIPHHSLAMSLYASENIPTVELSLSESLSYLKKDFGLCVDCISVGWVLCIFNGQKLGWIKNLGNRINNYYPTDIRIMMPITAPPELFWSKKYI